MKKILPLLLLLLLLIIFCVWTKKDSIHVSSDSQMETALAPMIATEKRYIDYTIKQLDDKSYALNGNFKDTEQQISLSDTVNQADKKLMIKNTSTNDTLIGKPSVELTNKILPHFMSHYVNGEISYADEKLKISGIAKSYKAQHEMQRLLNTSIIASQDNSSVAAAKPIVYTISKTGDKLHLTGTFNTQAQIDGIKAQLPSHATTDFKLEAYHTDKGSLPVVEKLLPSFVSKYTDGKIEYTDEKLTISGMVQSEAELMEIASQLNHSGILVNNHTIVDPAIKEAADLAEKEAALANAKAQADADAQAILDKEAEEKALADAEAKKEAERKAQADADAQAKLDKEAEEKALADAEAKKEAERKAQADADAQAKLDKEAEEKALVDAEALKDAELKVQADAEAQAKLDKEAEEKALADAQAQKEAELKAQADTDAQAKLDKEAELKTKIANLFKLGNIEFNVNKSTLTNEGQNTVNQLASILKEYTSVNIEIAGHTDSDGSAKYNQKLSQSRVDMVKNKLIAQKIAASRLTAKGYGETKPLVQNTTRANKAKNRRVEINIQGE